MAPNSRAIKVEWEDPGSRTILEEHLFLKGKQGEGDRAG